MTYELIKTRLQVKISLVGKSVRVLQPVQQISEKKRFFRASLTSDSKILSYKCDKCPIKGSVPITNGSNYFIARLSAIPAKVEGE